MIYSSVTYRTVMIWCGYGSDFEGSFGSSSGSRFPSQDNIWHSFSTKKLSKILPLQCQNLHYFPESWSLICDSSIFLIFSRFCFGSRYKSGSAKAISCGSWGSGSTILIYRGPGFFSPPYNLAPPPHSPLSKLSLFLSLPVRRRQSSLLMEGGGGSHIIRRRESLILYK